LHKLHDLHSGAIEGGSSAVWLAQVSLIGTATFVPRDNVRVTLPGRSRRTNMTIKALAFDSAIAFTLADATMPTQPPHRRQARWPSIWPKLRQKSKRPWTRAILSPRSSRIAKFRSILSARGSVSRDRQGRRMSGNIIGRVKSSDDERATRAL
jgi:hypothetical protein